MSRWQESAACRYEDPELFYPIGTRDVSSVHTAQAKRVCARCPVKSECLSEALRDRIRYGIWGGKTEHEREQMIRRARRTRAA